MKRSFINQMLCETIDFLKAHQFFLPPFAYWTPEQWRQKGDEVREIRSNALGWDITDFGSGGFYRQGLVLFTMRNGNITNPSGKSYCEKILIADENQVTPMHFHWAKSEDIINRGGGNLLLQLYNADKEEQLADTPVTVSIDGAVRTVPAGSIVTLTPGESITLTKYVYHKFWAEPDTGKVLGGEVSAVNDDAKDNRFLEDLPRFPGIEEDAEPVHLLCNEYPPAL